MSIGILRWLIEGWIGPEVESSSRDSLSCVTNCQDLAEMVHTGCKKRMDLCSADGRHRISFLPKEHPRYFGQIIGNSVGPRIALFLFAFCLVALLIRPCFSEKCLHLYSAGVPYPMARGGS